MVKEKTVSELKEIRDNNVPHQLIDVREQHEILISTIGGDHIIMADIMNEDAPINKDVPVIIYCRSGKRGTAIVTALQMKYKWNNLYNLKGGINAYASEIDNSLEIY